jgi:hypothetical protein
MEEKGRKNNEGGNGNWGKKGLRRMIFGQKGG